MESPPGDSLTTTALLTLVASMQQQLTAMQNLQAQTLSELRALTLSHASLASTVRSVSHTLHNKDRRFYTQLVDLPRELVAKILIYISPVHAVRLRRVSRAFDLLLRDPTVARESLRLHDPRKGKETTSKSPTEMDKTWFAWPEEYQLEYVHHRLHSLHEIDWRSHVFMLNSLPRALGLLTNLQHLTLYRCKLTGCIPHELGCLVNLVTLRLDDNSLTGDLPAELGNLTKLVYLCLDHNRLSGRIPVQLGNLVNLKLLNLKSNGLQGGVPGELRFLVQLQNLYLNGDKIDSAIPPEIVAGTVVYNLLRRDGFR
ncbi:hypothetical protein HDU98_001214 [Podochytrium sp. JEL0797]|nr:hypothetical protein HDU98_001214 [Podochytrium sp. JEL0797]